jgi:hypothetical protein
MKLDRTNRVVKGIILTVRLYPAVEAHSSKYPSAWDAMLNEVWAGDEGDPLILPSQTLRYGKSKAGKYANE